MKFQPYLTFSGKCREAMEFYKQCLGGELMLVPYAGTHAEKNANEQQKDYILHSSLTIDGTEVFGAFDSVKPETTAGFDGNVAIYINCLTEQELRQRFNLLSDGGSVITAVNKQYWNAIFGQLIDKFGVHWMLSHQPKS